MGQKVLQFLFRWDEFLACRFVALRGSTSGNKNMSRLVPLCIPSAVLWHREVLLPATSQAMLWVVLPMQKYLEIHRKIAHRRRKHFSQSSNATKQEQA